MEEYNRNYNDISLNEIIERINYKILNCLEFSSNSPYSYDQYLRIYHINLSQITIFYQK